MYAAFVIDAFARYIVGCHINHSMHTEFRPDSLEQALWACQPPRNAHIYHSDMGEHSKCLSARSSGSPKPASNRQWATRRQLCQRLGRNNQRLYKAGLTGWALACDLGHRSRYACIGTLRRSKGNANSTEEAMKLAMLQVGSSHKDPRFQGWRGLAVFQGRN